MRGSLTFLVAPDNQIQCKADLYEMTDFDLLRISTALQEQAFGLQLKLIKKSIAQTEAKKIISEAAEFKRRVDNA